MYFRLKKGVGNHAESNIKTGEVTVYKASDGMVFESAMDLVKAFPDKFERVDFENAPKKKKKKAPKEIVTEDIAPPKDVKEKKKVSLGKDVTKRFPIAEEQDFKVFFKKGKGFFVTESDDTSEALNEEKLKKDAVEAFIAEFLEE